MADFCYTCSIETFGDNYGDLAGLSTPENTAAGLYAFDLCEGCGRVLVDHNGIVVHRYDHPEIPIEMIPDPVPPVTRQPIEYTDDFFESLS